MEFRKSVGVPHPPSCKETGTNGQLLCPGLSRALLVTVGGPVSDPEDRGPDGVGQTRHRPTSYSPIPQSHTHTPPSQPLSSLPLPYPYLSLPSYPPRRQNLRYQYNLILQSHLEILTCTLPAPILLPGTDSTFGSPGPTPSPTHNCKTSLVGETGRRIPSVTPCLLSHTKSQCL